jgi:hypothetical protein
MKSFKKVSTSFSLAVSSRDLRKVKRSVLLLEKNYSISFKNIANNKGDKFSPCQTQTLELKKFFPS